MILTIAVAALLLSACAEQPAGPLGNGSWIDVAGRLMLVGYFIVTGVCNLTRAQIKWHIDYMAEVRTPFPAAAFWIGIVLQFTGCALILAGWQPAIGAYCLIVFIIAATAIFHRFWDTEDPMQRNLRRIFMLNNIGILGGLLLLLDHLPR